MAEVLLFHHIQGLTEGVVAFADELRASGHTVHAPDLFDGRTFDTIEGGFAYAQELGDAPDAKANSAADSLPEALVYAGFSWGVGSAQRLAQTRAGARGALLYESCFPITGEYAFGPWPDGVPVQIHGRRTTSSSRTRATSTLRASWSGGLGLSWASCSSTPVANTSSSIVRCRPTTPTLPR